MSFDGLTRSRVPKWSHEVFPGIGRCLTQDDVNKRVVRVFPLKEDCSFIPCKRIGVKGDLIKVLTADKIVFEGLYSDKIYEAQWLDNNWLTEDEFIAKTHFVAGQIFEIYDTRPFLRDIRN